jgi:transcriptional regulator with XRE-family HTH domain
MPRTKLDNYLRSYRRRAGLSQDVVAELLGSHSGTRVSRYERRTRTVPLEAALALEAVVRTPISDLFVGRFQEIRKSVKRRARKIANRITLLPHSPSRSRALEALAAILRDG